ncbi:unnamed protein product, partial [Prorocentrum cordatum]
GTSDAPPRSTQEVPPTGRSHFDSSSSEGRSPAAAAGAQLPWHTFDRPAPRTGDPPARRRCPLMPAGVLGAPMPWQARSFVVQLLCFVACAPPAAAASPEDCTACAAAPAEEDCSSSACRVSLLQSRREVTSPKASQSAALGAKLFARKPNIVLFLPDDMYFKDYSSWDQNGFAPAVPSRIPVTSEPTNNGGVMPNLEKIAQFGATFARAYTASPLCAPSRYSIMTGRYPSRSSYGFDKVSEYFPGISEGFVGQYSMLGQGYKDQVSTIGIALQSLGYATGMMGKWHLTPSEEANFTSPYSDQTAHVMRSGFDFVDGLYIANMCDCSHPICDTFNHNLEWMLDRAVYFMDDAMTKGKPFFFTFLRPRRTIRQQKTRCLGTSPHIRHQLGLWRALLTYPSIVQAAGSRNGRRSGIASPISRTCPSMGLADTCWQPCAGSTSR